MTLRLATAAATLALAACGSDSTADPAADPATEGAATEAPDAASGGTVPVAGETPGPVANVTPTPVPSATKSAPTAAPAVVAAAAPPEAFKQCAACHSTEPGKTLLGPSLAGIFGTKAAAVPGFKFSPAMAGSGLTWNAATLDTYLADPRKLVPGTTMGFGGVKDDAKRAAIIAYLKTL